MTLKGLSVYEEREPCKHLHVEQRVEGSLMEECGKQIERRVMKSVW